MQALIELLLALAALIAGIAAIALVIELRGRVSSLEAEQSNRRKLDADAQAANERVLAEVDELRRALEAAKRKLSDLEATQTITVPPLPRSRRAGLDDLREQLRASHLEPESSTEDG
jgi:hypothetical protein